MSDTIKREDALNTLLRMEGTKIDKALAMGEIRLIPSADRPQKVIAQITFDEEKLREIVKEAVERFKEEYEITDRQQGEWIDAEIPLESGGSMPIQVCNLCKTFYPLAYTGGGHRFCPNCGAHMAVKGADDENFDGEDECRWRDTESPNADDFCSYGERNSSEKPNNSERSRE